MVVSSSASLDASSAEQAAPLRHIGVLDGWRALSILFVLAGHLLPLGPKVLDLNETFAASGMAIFFTLSGFLITRFLIEDGNVIRFAIRRVFRIVPLAWLAMPLAIVISGGTAANYLGNLTFIANLPPFYLVPAGAHFWSLCLEMQFYLSIAMLVGVLGQRGLLSLPLICLVISGLRIAFGERMSIVTWFRIDEILTGATIALAYEGWLGARMAKAITRPSIIIMLGLLLASANRWFGDLAYLRPYFSALMVGASLRATPYWLARFSSWRPIVYIAQVSYAVYVFHGIFTETWLASGSKLVKYAKRPLLIGATFVCAHISTFHYERRWNRLGRKLT